MQKASSTHLVLISGKLGWRFTDLAPARQGVAEYAWSASATFPTAFCQPNKIKQRNGGTPTLSVYCNRNAQGCSNVCIWLLIVCHTFRRQPLSSSKSVPPSTHTLGNAGARLQPTRRVSSYCDRTSPLVCLKTTEGIHDAAREPEGMRQWCSFSLARVRACAVPFTQSRRAQHYVAKHIQLHSRYTLAVHFEDTWMDLVASFAKPTKLRETHKA